MFVGSLERDVVNIKNCLSRERGNPKDLLYLRHAPSHVQIALLFNLPSRFPSLAQQKDRKVSAPHFLCPSMPMAAFSGVKNSENTPVPLCSPWINSHFHALFHLVPNIMYPPHPFIIKTLFCI